jgi:hypothetical protein
LRQAISLRNRLPWGPGAIEKGGNEGYTSTWNRSAWQAVRGRCFQLNRYRLVLASMGEAVMANQ